MPELPEIETIRCGLQEKILGEPILGVELGKNGVIKSSRRDFPGLLTGRRFVSVGRRGKMLIFEIEPQAGEKQHYLLARLGMTGRLIYFGEEDALWGGQSFRDKGSFAHKHCHVILAFQHQGALLFCDARRFGYMEIVDEKGLEERLLGFGPEPLEKGFTLPVWRSIVCGRHTSIKALLLDQRRVAGIGNIYADEILFASGIDPRRPAGSLSEEETGRIHRAIKQVLKRAIAARGTTFSDYVDADGNRGGFQAKLKVYGRKGESCRVCSGQVEKIRLAGRGTYFCPRCQR